MRCSNQIYHRPFFQLNHPENGKRPFICQITPNETGFGFAWLDPTATDIHRVVCRLRGTETIVCEKAVAPEDRVEGLSPDTEYEFYIENSSGVRSFTRLVRTVKIPEGATVINYLHPEDHTYAFSGKYLCSPSIARLSNGTLVAGMDVYGHNTGENLTILFRSFDNGASWHYLCDLFPIVWGTLFVHRDALYMLGLSTSYGNLQITRSTDGGETWSNFSTLIYSTGTNCATGGVHRAPMHLVSYCGRLYTTCEYGNWTPLKSHLPAILSVDENADLLDPSAWNITNFLQFDGKWKQETALQGDTMEGNIVLAPDGQLYNYMRWKVGEALILKVFPDEPDRAPEYVRTVSMPVSNSMFRILPYRNGYLMVTNRRTEPAARVEYFSFRSVLSLYFSTDLEHWKFLRDVVNREYDDRRKVGFQYPASLLEEDGLSLVVRSAFGNADSAHNSNFSLFWHFPADQLVPEKFDKGDLQ